MNLQYITDAEGKTTGVFIPIQDWEKLLEKYSDIEDEFGNIPDWHKDIVRKRLADYKNKKANMLDFEEEIKSISYG